MKFIKRNLISLIALILFGKIFFTYIVWEYDEKIFYALLGTLATLYFGFIKHKTEDDRFFRELFHDFNIRYHLEFKDLLSDLKNSPDKKLTAEERNIVIGYLNLSAQEFLWRKKNRLPGSVWKAWKAGIRENLKIEQVKDIYRDEISSADGKLSYYGLVEELEK